MPLPAPGGPNRISTKGLCGVVGLLAALSQDDVNNITINVSKVSDNPNNFFIMIPQRYLIDYKRVAYLPIFGYFSFSRGGLYKSLIIKKVA